MVMHFNEGSQAKRISQFAKVAEFAGFEDSGDEEDSIRAMSSGLENLQAINGEIFAQNGQLGSGAGDFEIVQRALETRLVSEYREAGRAALFVLMGDAGGMKIGLQQAFAGGGFLDFGDDGGRLSAQLLGEQARRRFTLICGALKFRDAAMELGNFLLFLRNDFGQDAR